MRKKKVFITSDDLGIIKLTGEMKDERHCIVIELLLNEQAFIIEKAELFLRRIPRPRCRGCEKNFRS